jgi:hypothetical protein
VDLTLQCLLCDVTLHARGPDEITWQCLFCSSSAWRGFTSQLCEASFAHSNSCREYFAMLTLFIFYLARLHTLIQRGFFCSLEVPASLLCEACFTWRASILQLCKLWEVTLHTGSLVDLTLQCLLYDASLHARGPDEITRQCLFCSSSAWRGFISQL